MRKLHVSYQQVVLSILVYSYITNVDYYVYHLKSVHSRPDRRPRVGRICDKDLKCIMPFIVGLVASAARRPRVGRMRPIWRVIAVITPMLRPHAFNGGTVVKHWKSHYNITL